MTAAMGGGEKNNTPIPVSRPDADAMAAVILAACAAWETHTGRKLADENSLAGFLHALQHDEELWAAVGRQLPQDVDVPAAAAMIKTTLSALDSRPDRSLPEALAALDIPADLRGQLLDALTGAARRDAVISAAFAAASPGATARALEALAAQSNRPASWRALLDNALLRHERVTHAVALSVVAIAAIAFFILCGAQIKNMFVFAYKGVTPDPT